MSAAFQPTATKIVQALTPLTHSGVLKWGLGFLFGMPNFLLLLIVSLKWCHFTWPSTVRVALFTALAFMALTACLFLSLFSALLVWWRLQSTSFVLDLKTAKLLFSYTLLPMIYGVIGVWGIREKSGHDASSLLWGVALLYLAYSVVTMPYYLRLLRT